MIYYKIPLSGGLNYPAGCILRCAYTYDGYEYCKFERVTEVGSNWVPITEAEFNVLCPEFPTPSAPASTKHITETGEKNGMKYTVYSDGTAECWGVARATLLGASGSSARGYCNLYFNLPLEFSMFDSVHANIVDTASDPTDVFRNFVVQSIDADAGKSKLYVNLNFYSYNGNAIDSVSFFVAVRGVVA